MNYRKQSTRDYKMKFNTIQEIQNHQFFGNHFSDHTAFNAIDQFAQDESNSMSDRAESLRIMSDKGMSCGRDEQISDIDLVTEYVEECSM